MFPDAAQRKALEGALYQTRLLYNAALQERIECYKKTGRSISLYDQTKSLTEIRKDAEWSCYSTRIQRGALIRLDRAYKAFFRRVKTGGKAGFPRFQGKGRWDSLEINDEVNYKSGVLRIKGVGNIKVKERRLITGAIKTATLRKDVFGWRLSLVAECGMEAREKTGRAIGIDVGIEKFYTDSNGKQAANLHFLRRKLRYLRILNRKLSLKSPKKKHKHTKAGSRKKMTFGSRRYKYWSLRRKQLHWKITEQRRGFHWREIVPLVRDNDVIAVEELNVAGMRQNRHLSRAISDVGWSGFITKLERKAEGAGVSLIKVSPRNTSQACSGCGEIVKKSLSQRWHSCACGVELDRDHNAAINILRAVSSPPLVNVGGYAVRSARTAKKSEVYL